MGGSTGTGSLGRGMGTQKGRFTGRGPKGYKRSDERVREDICDRLMQHDEIDADDVEVNVSNGEVTLQGTVESRQMKHTIENLIDSVQGVQEVHNQLRIKRSGHETGAGQSGQSANQETSGLLGSHGQSSTTQGQAGQTTGSQARTTGQASQTQGQESQKTEGKSDKNQETKGQATEGTRRNSAS